MAGKEESPISAQDKGEEEQQVGGCHQPKDSLERDREQAVEHGQGVEGQVDAQGIEHIVAVEGIRPQLEQGMFDPPQVPGERGVVCAIPRHVAANVRDQRPGQDQRKKSIGKKDQQVDHPTFGAHR